ncbi:MAG: sigma-70 family RNA polymerase sigma factor [Bacteroidetes bacterium]|nr:sigma-70 family RNA polymerase sigma factor [Bacteroidota bacterium]
MTRQFFKEIFDNHFDTVRNYIYYRSGDTELATDIAQDAFLRIWEKQIDPYNNNVVGLLIKISGDLLVSNYRKQKVASNFKLNIQPRFDSQSPADTMQFIELKNRYNQALGELPEKQRTVFLMSRMDNLKYHEIAAATGISTKAVEKRMKNALSYLRKELNY